MAAMHFQIKVDFKLVFFNLLFLDKMQRITFTVEIVENMVILLVVYFFVL